jgi:uncharacterized protein
MPTSPRRRFLKALLAAIPAMAGGAYVNARYIEPSRLSIERIDVRSPRIPRELDGVTIGQISDLHMGGPIDDAFVLRAARELAALKPDLAVVTGDLIHISGIAGRVSKVLDVLRSAPLGSYLINGNHDRWHDADRLNEVLANSGHTQLNNAQRTLQIRGVPLHIVGLDDIWEDAHDIDRALQNVPDSQPAILLAHEPDYADIAARRFPFVAQLSGHTHGGQVRMPFRGAVALPPWGRRYVMGRYDIGGMALYVNRGIGMADPGYRFLCAPELTLLTLRAG